MGEQTKLHIRLVTLGAGGAGKSCILRRFLFNTYLEKHRPTVEDLFTRDFAIGTMLLKVDFLDTAGDLQFPAMRRLSITNAHAFLIVYAIDDPISFDVAKAVFEEIREIRSDFQEIPIIFAGNKLDLVDEGKRQVQKEDVAEWVFCELPKLRTKVIETSARNNTNVKSIFTTFLQLAKIPLPSEQDQGLKRRSSAHTSTSALSPASALSPSPSPKPIPRFGGHHTLSPNRSLTEPEKDHDSGATASVPSAASSLAARLKPRSRSLIRRRSSRKAQKLKEHTSDADDCAVS